MSDDFCLKHDCYTVTGQDCYDCLKEELAHLQKQLEVAEALISDLALGYVGMGAGMGVANEYFANKIAQLERKGE